MDIKQYPLPMTYSELEAATQKIEYRPGWQISVFQDPHEGPKLRVVATVIDGYHPDQTTDLGINSRIPDIIENEDQFYRWILWRLLEIEAHECREYFRVDGRLYRDPHDPIEPKN